MDNKKRQGFYMYELVIDSNIIISTPNIDLLNEIHIKT